MKNISLHFFFILVLLALTHAESAKDLLEQGNQKRFAGDQDGAIVLYNRAILLSPEDPYAYTMRGFSHEEKGDHESAYKDFKKAVELAPRGSIYHNNLGNILIKLGKPEDAMSKYGEAIRLDPNNIQAYFDRAKLRHDQGDDNGAMDDLKKASTIKPPIPFIYDIEGWQIDQRALIYKLLGDSKLKFKDYKGAVEDYTKALEETPKYPHAYEGRAEAKDGLGDSKGSVEDRAKAKQIRDDPNKIPTMPRK
jgi:tetratricopeptide (TPR) repeat protein